MRMDKATWFIAGALFLCGMLYGLVMLGCPVPFTIKLEAESFVMAAWVQALGSICAVVAAINIASSQRRAQDESERSARQVRMATLKSICMSLTDVVDKGTFVGSERGHYVRRLISLCASLDAIDLLSLPMPELVEPTAKLKLALSSYVKGFKESWGEARTNTQIIADAVRNLDTASYFSSSESKRNIKEIKKSAEELVTLISQANN